MIASVGGRYHDVVCICPIDKLDADILHEMWKNVLARLTAIGFDVVVSSVDGHSSNRKFYKEKLCEGVWKISIQNPTNGEYF